MKVNVAARTTLLGILALAHVYGQSTCITFPNNFIPFSSISYVTAANAAGDHLVAGSLANGAAGVSAIKANVPLPAFANQMFCGQVQLAPGQYYSNVYVPTAAELSGNFSAFSGLLVNPANNQPYSGGIIPAAQLGAVFAWRIGPTQVASPLQGWSLTGSLLVEGTDLAAILLPTGKVLVMGSGPPELYEPKTGTFAGIGPALFNHGFDVTMTLLNDGRVLIVGGGVTPSAAELYDPVANRFLPTGAPLQPHGYRATATLLTNGQVLVVGGATTPGVPTGVYAGAELYDPSKGIFVKAGPISVNTSDHRATLLQDGRVLITGGYAGAPPSQPLTRSEVYDPATGIFSPVGPMQVGRNAHTSTLLPDGRVLIAGGYGDPLGSAELFNPTTGVFTQTGSMSTPRAGASATLISNGEVLVVGGFGVGPAYLAVASTDLFNPATGTFSPTGNTIVARGGPGSALLPDGRVLIVGGNGRSGTAPYYSSAEIYTPLTQGLVTSQTGLTFRAAQGASTLAAQSVAVLSSTDTLPWTASTHTYTGGNWLSVTPSSGTSAPGTTPVALSISASPSGLAARDYYGSVTLTPTDGKHPPVTIAIVLSIVPAGTAAPPAVTPNGLVFLSAPGATVQPQSFTISNLTSSVIGFNATATGTPNWFTFTPKASGISPGQSVTVTVTPVLTGLTASVFRGSIVLNFSDGSSQAVDLLLVISSSAGATSGHAEPRAAPTCKPSTLLPVFTSLGTGFTTPVAWPTPLAVQVQDDCGNPMNTGTVTVSFSNGDVPLSLLGIGNGAWTATWVPTNSTATTFGVRTDAQLAPLSGTVQVLGQVKNNPNVPRVASSGVVSSGDYSGAPALGLLVSIFGSALADGQAQAGSLPLPDQLGSTSVVVSGEQLPVLFVNDKQVNVLIPYDLAVNAPHELIVQRGNAISVPVPFAVFDSQPAILATAGNGMGQGHVYKIDASGNQILADANAPATAGDYLVIYAVGLGAVSPALTAGDPASGTNLSQTVAPVTLTIGGQQATVFFAGLTPGLAGLYQVNASVPAGIAPGAQVPVVLSVAGKSSSGNIFMGIQ
ncbi:MAG TPA: kelch repeat-containing protein [Bryobacteraceae bacterium]|nr:kelch repeat-containing protein [Bryobacteraceae bacterium]